MTVVMYGAGISAPVSPWDPPKPLEPIPAVPFNLFPAVTLSIDPITFAAQMERMTKALETMAEEMRLLRLASEKPKQSLAERSASKKKKNK
jgi:hypothetical protein